MIEAKVYCDNMHSAFLYTGCDFKLEVKFEDVIKRDELVFGVVIKNILGDKILALNNKHLRIKLSAVPLQKDVFTFLLKDFPIYGEGKYFIDIFLGEKNFDFEIITDTVYFYVKKTDLYGTGILPGEQANKCYFKQVSIALKEI